MAAGNKFLFHLLLLFLMAGSIAGLFISASLVLRPAWLLHASGRAKRWIATRQTSSQLVRVIKVDSWFYRHHGISGIMLLAGAIFLIYFFSVRLDKLRILVGLSNVFDIPLVFSVVLLDSAVLSVLLGASFALIVSMFLLVRPSMLRGFEQGANQWISLRQVLKPNRFEPDEALFQNVQMVGVLLLFVSLYTLAVLTTWL